VLGFVTIQILANDMTPTVKIIDNMLESEYSHPFIDIDRQLDGGGVWFGADCVEGINQRVNVRIIVRAVVGTLQPGPAVTLGLLDFGAIRQIGGAKRLQPRHRIGCHTARVAKLESPVYLVEIAGGVPKRPLVQIISGRLQDGFEHPAALHVGDAVDLEPDSIAVAERQVHAIGDPIGHLLLNARVLVSVTAGPIED
jgi:hypothetical protein